MDLNSLKIRIYIYIYIYIYILQNKGKSPISRFPDANQFEQLFTFSPLPSHTFLVIIIKCELPRGCPSNAFHHYFSIILYIENASLINIVQFFFF